MMGIGLTRRSGLCVMMDSGRLEEMIPLACMYYGVCT